MSDGTIRGIDHVGVTVHDLEAATAFLKAAFGAEVLCDTLPLGEKPQAGSEAEQRLHLRPGAVIHAVRMLRLHNGPGVELFQTTIWDCSILRSTWMISTRRSVASKLRVVRSSLRPGPCLHWKLAPGMNSATV
jgi:hypothetical protein